MPSFGLSLTRLTQTQPSSGKPEPPAAAPAAMQQQQVKQEQQPQAAAAAAGSSAAAMARALSVDNFAMTSATSGPAAAGPAPAADAAGGRAAMYRSFSCVATDTLPMDFSLGYGDGAFMGASCSGGGMAFGARGRSVSLNETQLRRQQWLHEGELLAPQLPPSVSELELLELPEDPVPLRPFKCASFLGGLNTMADSSLTASAAAAANAAAVRPMTSGMMQFKGAGAAAGADTGAGEAGATTTTTTTNNNGVTVTVKRKIITSPSPLLQQGKGKARQPVAPAAVATAGPGVQSPKRAKVGGGSGFGGWQQSGGGGMKVVRSVPSNMNNFLEGVEVTVQPMGHTGVDSVVSPNASSISASTPNAQFGAGPFFDPAAAARSGAAMASSMMAPQSMAAAAGKGGKAKAAVPPAGVTVPVPPVQGVGPVPPGMIPGLVPGTFMAPGMAFPEAKRPVPSVPKPRKRASPNGNPPKAPAPNPNGHCCTQCGTQTTPVWRAGPHGPKTLCNACGVRYMKVAKSGATQPAPRRQQQQHQ
ncbi:hypothetical protein HXX76_001355 [Chlamydomonas incerta]|uniref:GATA-type domain-containing protein n=1 Tax=Chlamydomonas incerta TaxID=51695 RepID=A0A835WC01_CHLIN|nr:hypothetical protein HXX76_001355 [Chlamydomonas incerta]|eukprot:KAG2444611.1 hypothetical protein HXX76_001355 [Chlamydomonas incerta]